MWQSVEILNVCNALTLKQIFWKTKTFFKNLEYRFLVESTSASFPYKTAISEANVKANRMVSTKWTYHKWSFAGNYFIFWKFCFTLWTLKKSWLMYQQPKCSCSYFSKALRFIWGWFFPASILNRAPLNGCFQRFNLSGFFLIRDRLKIQSCRLKTTNK